MSDRDGIVLYASSPARLRHAALASLASVGVGLAIAPVATGFTTIVIGALTVVSTTLLSRRRKLLFRARALELHWLHTLREIPYIEMTGLAIEPDRVRLRLRGGAEEVFEVPGMGRMNDAIGLVIQKVTGLAADGAPPALAVGRSDQLVATLRLGGDVDGFVDAIARTEPMLADAGLDVAALGLHPETYRDARDRDPAPELLDVVRLAEIRKAQQGGGEITAVDVLLALYLEGATETRRLVRAGLRPMRLVDHVAHRLTPEESDARAEGRVSFAVDASRVAVEVINDPFTPTVVAVDLIEQLVASRAEAEQIAGAIYAHGRARIGTYPRSEGERRANALMKAARVLGSPLLVELVAVE